MGMFEPDPEYDFGAALILEHLRHSAVIIDKCLETLEPPSEEDARRLLAVVIWAATGTRPYVFSFEARREMRSYPYEFSRNSFASAGIRIDAFVELYFYKEEG